MYSCVYIHTYLQTKIMHTYTLCMLPNTLPTYSILSRPVFFFGFCLPCCTYFTLVPQEAKISINRTNSTEVLVAKLQFPNGGWTSLKLPVNSPPKKWWFPTKISWFPWVYFQEHLLFAPRSVVAMFSRNHRILTNKRLVRPRYRSMRATVTVLLMGSCRRCHVVVVVVLGGSSQWKYTSA